MIAIKEGGGKEFPLLVAPDVANYYARLVRPPPPPSPLPASFSLFVIGEDERGRGDFRVPRARARCTRVNVSVVQFAGPRFKFMVFFCPA